MAVTLGDEAPGITLRASTGDFVSLERYHGERPVVLLLFPLAFSPVCTNELIAIARRLRELRGDRRRGHGGER